MRSLHWLLFIVVLSGCATIGLYELDEEYGFSDHNNRPNKSLVSTEQFQHYQQNVRPIIENRCVVCHGCYDAPCQLKLESNKGLERGASKVQVYDGARLKTLTPTSFVNNVDDIGHWRKQGFFPVLNERRQTEDANEESSVFYQMLELKDDFPLPDEKLLDESFDLALDRSQQCPTIEEFDSYRENTPLAGMPYGLPNLADDEYDTLTQWLEDGALAKDDEHITANEAALINTWETFLNAPSLKSKLVSRYIFEHLYLANLFFTEGNGRFFTLVRSTTPSGSKINPITTRRPFDSPGDNDFYYRLKLNVNTVIAKRHLPYRFELTKLARYKALFFDQDYQVEKLPSYEISVASNPFKTFQDIPVKSRYLFLLEEAQFTIMNFIKGPVCRGQIALNVIRDDFWVFFSDPHNIDLFHIDQFLAQQTDHLQLPASTSTGVLSILDWRKYAKEQKLYLSATQDYLASLNVSAELDFDLIWQGGGNPNAALTVFRHFDSATVLKGAVGSPPKTTWVLGYPLMERIHYLLVAGFDVYGDVSHQLKTRLYMDFLRMEGESNFVMLLPENEREKTFKSWYLGIDDAITGYSYANNSAILPDTSINYVTNAPKTELQQRLKEHVAPSIRDNYSLAAADKYFKSLSKVSGLTGAGVATLPQVSHLRVTSSAGTEHFYSLINNSEHMNVANLFSEEDRRIPEGDSLFILKGIVGTYPNAFFDVTEQQLNAFSEALANISSESDYIKLKDNFAIRRTSASFWRYADDLHAWYKKHQPNDYGLLDFNRLENR